jgi:hypothetical protein
MSDGIKVEKLTQELFDQFVSLYHFRANEVNPEILQGYFSRSIYSYILLVDNAPSGAFGIVPLWQGVCECWFMSSPALDRYPLFLVKNFRKLTDELLKNGMHRVQILVHNTRSLNRWAQSLGFTYEGVLRRYGIDKKDNAIYSKIWDTK